MQQSYEVSSLTHRYLNGKELKWSEFSERENYARNGAKHLLRNGGKLSDVELRRSAIWMIARACANYEHLGHERTDRMRDFDNWFYEHEVGM